MRHLILTALLITACTGSEDSGTDCPDTDRDGVCDATDLCTGDDATGDTDSDGVCDALDICTGDDADGDADLDGICDGDNDLCFGDDTTLDTDRDGVCNDLDECVGDDALGDADNDNVCDGEADACFGDDLSGDSDADGVCDDSDQCVGNDAVGDADNDGVCNDTDVCTGDDTTGDTDLDAVCDDIDACPGENDLTADPDNDGVCGAIDVCDGNDATGDDDNDAVCNDIDQCEGNDAQPDTDGDGVCEDIDQCTGDDATGDADTDGICDNIDQCTGNDAQPDTDGDGVCEDIDQCTGDDATGDADTDGICDDSDLCTGNDAQPDTDGDGICEDIDLCLGDDETGDTDRDGTCDDSDACIGNDTTGNTDGDDYCDDVDQCDGDDLTGDSDDDGTCDDTDACIGDDTTGNEDGDDYCNNVDQCDGDDALGDFDNDGLCNDTDPCTGSENVDTDRDGICDGENDLCEGDDASGDSDGDGVCDDIDLCYGLDRLGDGNGDNLCGDGTVYHVISGIVSRFHDGLTWSNAFRSPELAAEVAEAGDTIFMRSIPSETSAYEPTQVFVNQDVQWIAGFQASETHPDDRPTDRITGLPVPTPHGDIRASSSTEHWVVDGGYVDAVELRGYRVAAMEVTGEAVLNNIVIAEENTAGPNGSSAGLAIQEPSDVRISEFRCTNRDVFYNRCLTMNNGTADVMTAVFDNVGTTGFGEMVNVNGGTLRMNNVKTSGVTAGVFAVNINSELVVTSSSLSNITTFASPAIVSSSRGTVRITDTVMENNTVTGGVDIEGGLIGGFRSDITLNRVHIANTTLENSESIEGGVIALYNPTSFDTFDMRDSSIHGTSYDYNGSVSGGVIYLDSANTFLIGNTFGPVDSPFSDSRVQGALLHLNTIQASITNNAMWTPHELPIQTTGQQNVAWGALCAPVATLNARQGPTAFVELTASPFATPEGFRLQLATGSPCIDEGNTLLADIRDIWWPGRASEVGTSRDIAPVDLGAHYNP